MPRARKGSVLATSISLVSVFLTLVLAGMAYVQSSQNRGLSDKFRLAAEQAARSGMDFVLGYGEANIDKETRLPRSWDSMSDGQIIDPVTESLNLNSTDGITDIQTVTGPGQILGTQVREYVLGKQGNYVTSFKARIQQFRVSDSMPRQYRIGVVGRVRKMRNTGANVDSDERSSIVAERVIVAHVGKEPVSKYAALIDIDVVRNWVPGEVVDGPVHINRGYIDEYPTRNQSANNLVSATMIDADGEGSTPNVPMDTLRSRMDLVIDDSTLPGNPGFTTPTGGAKNHPVFNGEVTITEIGKKATGLPTNTDLKIKNYDYDDTAGGFVLNTTPTKAVTINTKPWNKGIGNDAYLAKHADIFKNPANSNTRRYGTAAGNPCGPTPVSYPIQLPRSVRNRLAAAVGAPVGGLAMHEIVNEAALTTGGATPNISSTRWDRLPDGIYIPTSRFWAIGDNTSAPDPYRLPANNSYDSASFRTTGGIYIRGNVEIMRMAAKGDLSYYFFQLGPGSKVGPRRVFGVEVNRTSNTMKLKAFAHPAGAASANGNMDLMMTVFGANRDAQSLMGGAATTTDPASFYVATNDTSTDSQTTGQVATFVGEPGRPPFNGVIYVDCSRWDQGRPENGPAALTSTPVTGNIFCLGDPGNPANPRNVADRRARALGVGAAPSDKNGILDNQAYEGVATYSGNVVTNPATKLTIMARGNIYIQNHILLDSLVQQNFAHFSNNAGAELALSTLTIDKSQDLIGLVADKQIQVGLAAPSTTTRADIGLYVHAAIAALGDPSFRYNISKVLDTDKAIPAGYAGSFGTEGLLQVYGTKEDGHNAYKPILHFNETPQVGNSGTQGSNIDDDSVKGSQFTYFRKVEQNAGGDPSKLLGYPANPFYEGFFGTGASSPVNDTTAGNPNKSIRGRVRMLGALTEKKRGIKGQGNRSYDKDFIFDKRLLTIAPPIFPASLNIIVRTQSPFSPDSASATRAVPYKGTTNSTVRDLGFLGANP